jgi:hypothetical protein
MYQPVKKACMKRTGNPAVLFLVLALVTGVLTVILHGPVNAADENSHLWRAFLISDGRFFPVRSGEELDGCRGPVPECLVDLVYNRLWNSPHNRHPLGREGVRALLRERCAMLSAPYRDEPRLDAALGNAPNFGPVCYLPQAGGILLGRLTGASPLGLIYWGRFANLAVYLLIGFAALCLMPKGRYVLFIVAVTPMAILQAASLSADAMTNALAWLFIALLMRRALAEKPRITALDMAALIAVQTALTFSKPAYFFLSFLIFLTPAARFGSRKRYFTFLAIFFGAQLLSVLAMAWIAGLAFVQPAYADRDAQLLHILRHPFRFVAALALSAGASLLRQVPSLPETLAGSVGFNPFFSVPAVTVALFLAAYLAAGLAEAPVRPRGKGTWLLMAGVFALSMLQIYTMLYLYWTPVGHYIVHGVHGRVFLPLLPLALLLLPRWRIAERWRGALHAFLATVAVVGCVSLIWTLAWTFWLPRESLIPGGNLRLRAGLPGDGAAGTTPGPKPGWRLEAVDAGGPGRTGWKQRLESDAAAPAPEDFGVTLNVEKHTRYLLYVNASTSGSVAPECYVWSRKAGDTEGFILLDDEPFLKLRPGRAQQHVYGCFRTAASETIRITAYPAGGRKGDTIRWHAWALTEN